MTKAAEEISALRSTGGFARLGDLGLIEVSGDDAARLLQARTCNDIAQLSPGRGQLNCLLNRTAHLQAVFWIYRLEDSFWIVAEKGQVPAIIEQIELYHFREQMALVDRSAEGTFWTIQGPESLPFLAEHLRSADIKAALDLDAVTVELDGKPVMLFKQSLTGEDGYLLWFPSGCETELAGNLQAALEAAGFAGLGTEALETARVEAGFPRYRIDISADDLITDTGLEQVAVSYTKGCYVGQEVVARIKTYSAPRKGLVGLMFPPGSPISYPCGTPCSVDSKEIGQLKSNVFSPTLGRTIALAFLTREYRQPDTQLTLEIEGSKQEAKVVLLPFYTPPSRQERARQLYERALALFAGDREAGSIGLLRKALNLDPLSPDVYEALGVILSRQGEIGEAVELMQHLAQLDPDSVMAHTNLSVFYMQLGDKERAEEEKAVAMSIQMRKLAMEAAAQQKQQEDERRRREEALDRMRMFRAVLEIDSEDLLANYGLGSAHVDLAEFEQAVPYLEKAIKVKPTHTVAYLALGKAFEGLKDTGKAMAAYKEGIDVASKRGDMMPLKEMQSRLVQLESAIKQG
ncbi:MAG TPA: tetratricopeptide repeat protein [Candidatus Obscuribacterales bacterium]